MLNSGLGFSDEFEMEACNYSEKSGSKFRQQYREWSYTMRKEGSAFFRSVKDKVCSSYIKLPIRFHFLSLYQERVKVKELSLFFFFFTLSFSYFAVE